MIEPKYDLRREIARLEAAIAWYEAEIDRLQRQALEAEQNWAADWKREVEKLEAEIARLEAGRKALLKTNQWQAREIERLRAALEEIVRNGDQGIHVTGPYDIAKVALGKEGK